MYVIIKVLYKSNKNVQFLVTFRKFVYMYPTDVEETCIRGRRRAEPQAAPIRFLQSEGSKNGATTGVFPIFPSPAHRQ